MDRFWSGTINVANGITIANGSTLTIQPAATLKFSSVASLTINGKIVASSTNPSQRITFTGTTATPGFWGGIKINSGSSTNVSTLRRCDIEYATDGISITYNGTSNDVMVDKCKVRNNASDGIYINGNGYSYLTPHPAIRNNIISNNGNNGIDLVNYAKPFIRINRLENNGGSGIYGSSNCPAQVRFNLVSANAEFGLWFAYSSSVELHRNTITSNAGRGVFCASNSNLVAYAYGVTDTLGRNKITDNTGIGIYAASSSPIFGKGVLNPYQYGNNWIYGNTSTEAVQTGAGYLLRAERCYWNGQHNQISGNVDVTPYLPSAPNPAGWGQDDNYDPTYLIMSDPQTIAEMPTIDAEFSVSGSASISQDLSVSATLTDWSDDLKAAMNQGLATGDWSQASELITKLHRELQDGRMPNVDFALVTSFAGKPEVASFIRKMLALVLVEKDLVESNVTAALAKLAAFGQSNPENASELLANVGLIRLYRQSDLAGAENVLSELQARAQNGDTTAVEHVHLFGRILEDYRRHLPTLGVAFQRSIESSAEPALEPATSTPVAQSYPNPFNPETRIRFRLPQATHVKVVIYNVAGQVIRRVVDGELAAGQHILTWDGRDDNGRAAPSGTYFLQIEAGGQSLARKLLLLR